MRSARLATLALFLAACSSSGTIGTEGDASPELGTGDAGSPDSTVPGLLSLRIDPPTQRVVDDGVAPGETAVYHAIGTFSDGERDISTTVTWTIDDDMLATIVAGTATTQGLGGSTMIHATAGALSANAELIVELQAVFVTPGTPPGAAGMFPADTSTDVTGDPASPHIVYPSQDTMFPINLAPVLDQWHAGAALDLFEVRMDSDVAHVRFYTTARTLLPDLPTWSTILHSSAGRSLVLSVRGLSTAAATTIYRSQDVTLHASPSEVLGALYYWSTGAQGVMRAHISASSATKFFTDPATGDNTCVACHTVSRDGRRLAAGYGGEHLREVTVPDRMLVIPATPTTRGPDASWSTFNPGATRLLYARRGVLTLLDADTGTSLGTVPLPAMHFATMPDWSPDGHFIAVAYSATTNDRNVVATSIARIPVNTDGTFGTPEVIVASAGATDTNFFPSYSPDSRWIAFVRAVNKSDNNVTSQIMIVAADGSSPPVEATVLNHRVNDMDGVGMTGTTMPTWAPSTTPDTFWLAVSSVRAYGDVLPAGRDQLWAAAIDPARLAAGTDPAYAAFWMPFQEIDQGNHRAFWALAGEDVCPSTVEICDGLDNDCDGIVDEMCCSPASEVCGDGVDQDCDGADLPCCGPIEICGNGIDDDCDLLVDGEDPDCMLM